MDFKQALKAGFVNFAKFDGRASRSEYWWFILAIALIALVLDAVEGLVTGKGMLSANIYVLSSIWYLATLVPSISVATRRLHDIGRSGWWQLIGFTIIGLIPLIYWLAKRGDAQANVYGADPL